jgi:hypothetical protein
MDSIEDFIKKLAKAIINNDIAFLKRVYGEWFDTSGVAKQAKFEDIVASMTFISTMKINSVDSFDDFAIIHGVSDDNELELVFQKTQESWIYVNNYSHLSEFKCIYSINYSCSGKMRLLFNKKRSPFISDGSSDSTIISMINSALKVGENELTIQVLEGSPVNAMIIISSGSRGEIMDSNSGEVLNWSGKINKSTVLKFTVN